MDLASQLSASPSFTADSANSDCLPNKTDAVRDVTNKLAALGYYPGASCDDLDKLRDALKKFQREKLALDEKSAAFGRCNFATWQALNQAAGSSFAEVWQNELDAIRGSQVADSEHPDTCTPHPASQRDVCARAHQADLAGLALSGGGIRSATFNLGILQAFAEHKLLHQFDYLSTVSGGGYIGAWLSKWIKEEGGDVREVEKLLTPGSAKQPAKSEAHEIKFLRQYSNYLTPQTGAFSADSWSMISTWIRNTLLNLCILISLLAAMMVLPYLLVSVINFLHQKIGLPSVTATVFFVFAVYQMGFQLKLTPRRSNNAEASQRRVLLLIVLPLLISAAAGSIALWQNRVTLNDYWHLLKPTTLTYLGTDAFIVCLIFLPGSIYFLAWCAGWMHAQTLNQRRRTAQVDKGSSAPISAKSSMSVVKDLRRHEMLWHLIAALLAYAVGSVLTLTLLHFLHIATTLDKELWHMAHLLSIGVPLLVVVYGCTMVLQVGLIGRLYSEQSREWWSRLGGWIAISLLIWSGIFMMTFYAPPFISWLHYMTENRWLSASVCGGWLVTTLSGLAMGHSKATNGKDGDKRLELLVTVAPYVFVLGILGLISTFVHFVLGHAHAPALPAEQEASLFAYIHYYVQHAVVAKPENILAALLGFTLLAVLFAWRMDINKFSLHMMSRNRLVRAYLGASSKSRLPHPFIGFDPHDDPQLASLHAPNESNTHAQRPYHLLNTCLNLTAGKELAWQNRKAANFLFSPLFCGYQFPTDYHNAPQFGKQLGEQGCFRPTAEYGGQSEIESPIEQGTRLGMAVAISGAAVSPAMGYHSSPTMSFLLTLFNLRLGHWCGNPRKATWRTLGPRFGLKCMISELFGNIDADADYVYLSDGGHFENLGIYELVRRRCRLIVVVDASADNALQFEDLGNAIRKCYTDMGVRIELNVSEIASEDGELSRKQCVAGVIHYENVDKAWKGEDGTPMVNAQPGVLLYIKPSLTGKEMADILNYRKLEKTFPHESTADQFFDEAQFESYRTLGYQIGCIAIQDALKSSRQADGEADIGQLAQALLKQWQSDK